jgi:NAD(P)-dependent dehydrogenase (short-subunit alcohol dehydrogenase family)
MGDDTTMTGKIALVIGANGGLGKHVTKALLDASFSVAGVAPHIQQSDFDHSRFVAVPGEITTLEAAKKVVSEVLERLGRIDVLAHLVGGFAGGQTVAQLDDSTWERMFDVNLNSAFHLLRAVIPHMRKAGSGRIVAIGSRSAEDPGPKVGAYSASKAALVSLVRTVALENMDGGRCRQRRDWHGDSHLRKRALRLPTFVTITAQFSLHVNIREISC